MDIYRVDRWIDTDMARPAGRYSCQPLGIDYKRINEGDRTGKLGKFGQYKISACAGPGSNFQVPDISDSSRTVHKFVPV